MAGMRMERDSMGEVPVPDEAYYGAQTGRAARNFQVSDLRFPRAFIRALGLIKKSAARVNQGLGLLDAERASAIIDAAQAVADGKHDDQFVLDIFQTGSGTSTNMNANEVIAGLANESVTGRRGGRSPVHPNDAVNLGQSSNDVIPTAIHLAALDGWLGELIPAIRALRDALGERARAFDQVVKIGRTHLQDAVPIRLGQEFSGYEAQASQAIRRLEGCVESLAELAIGGTAVGTGINTHPDFGPRMVAALAEETGLPVRLAANHFEAMAQRDAAVEASGTLRAVAISLSVMANNIRWLASGPRCGIGEIRIPELQPGSSIMPGKVNPVIPECVLMVGAQVVGHDATIAWANSLGSSFQLNVMMPVIAYNLLQSIRLVARAADHLRTCCIDATAFLEGLKVDGVACVEADLARCEESIEKSLAMGTALAPRIGYDLAASIAKKAYHEGRTVREVALGLVGRDARSIAQELGATGAVEGLDDRGGYPSRREIEELLDPRSQTSPGAGASGGGSG